MAMLALASGCFIHKSIPAVQDRPVPAEASLRWLDGEWEGTYQSQLAGSRGTIRFKLTAKADSAYGTGILLARPPRQPRTTAMPMFHPPPGQQFSIVFIPCHSGLITGTLDLYEDPETGERIYTSFDARLEGTTLQGTFESYHGTSGLRITGTWSVTRKRG